MNDTYDSRWISRRRFLKEAAAVIGGATLLRTFPAAAAPTLRPLRQEAAVNIMDPAFGVKGDGTTNDRAAFQAAMDAAVAAGVPLWIPRPEQFYRIVLEPEHRNLRVNGD
ncbi:MAG TPA: twin-arginine translocation signal domain-containing protein, partial [Promineifilum sp.]|nr:twin-arginine translocation signal domain-containing protein [Promineifilum sp.]